MYISPKGQPLCCCTQGRLCEHLGYIICDLTPSSSAGSGCSGSRHYAPQPLPTLWTGPGR